ncbi:TIGR01212 family radical SAM protein [Ruminococcus sp. HUN007]|uniref:TIGR01212 family radical SAM protein n=1 Tax=Ruminococcus sp. HUN007 TaxID=1514668 RepID=UPI000A4DA48B
MNEFDISRDNKRYYTQNRFLRETFGEKVIKLSVNTGLSCPNRDGKCGTGGCIYCSPMLSGDFSGNSGSTITDQMTEQIKLLSGKWKSSSYIAYFQAGTNTYAPVNTLRAFYNEALAFPGTRGITIATRADCLSDEITELLSELSEHTFLTVELGLQTIHDKTAELINRGHSFSTFIRGFSKLKERGIRTCIHMINGLPGETYEMMMETAETVSSLHPGSVKIHMLHIIRGTKLAEMYTADPFPLPDRDEYISLVCDQIEIMAPDTVIERVTGDGDKKNTYSSAVDL